MKASEVPVKTFDDVVRLIGEEIERGKKDPYIHQTVSSILSRKVGESWEIPPKDYDREVRAVFDYVKRNVRYQHDTHGVDTFRSARRTLELRAGDCDDMTIVLGSLLGAAGYPVKLRVVSTSGKDYDHIYPLVGIPPTRPTRWIALDASEPYPAGWEVPRWRVQREKTYDALGGNRRVVPLWAVVFLLLGVVGLVRLLQ
ncbi:MAG: transglutaminase domain-containing protein [bacterium JZ-2024 1]